MDTTVTGALPLWLLVVPRGARSSEHVDKTSLVADAAITFAPRCQRSFKRFVQSGAILQFICPALLPLATREVIG